MARFPRIDQPCPLAPDAQKRIKGDCGLCGKTVHCLDGKSDAERAEFMRKASGPVCVSYRLTAGISAALALSIAGPLAASPVEAPTDTTSPAPATAHQAESAPVITFQAGAPPQTPVTAEEALDELDEVIFLGGVSKPGEAEWVGSDESLPELPMREEPAAAG
jgi:hypothetical protein